MVDQNGAYLFKKRGVFIVVGGRMYLRNIDLTLQSMKGLRRNTTTLN